MGYLSELISEQEVCRENARNRPEMAICGPSTLPGVVTDGTDGVQGDSSLFAGASDPATPITPKPSFALRGQEGFREAWERMEREESTPKPELPRGEGNPFRYYLPLVAAAKAGEIARPAAPGLCLDERTHIPDVNAFVVTIWECAAKYSRQRKRLHGEMAGREISEFTDEPKRLGRVVSDLYRSELYLALCYAYWSGRGQAAFPASFDNVPATTTERRGQ